MCTPLVISEATNVLYLLLPLVFIFPLPALSGVSEGGSMGMGLSCVQREAAWEWDLAVSTSVAEWLAAGMEKKG
jgi:hypothetical protein